jgi:hypothetical protein
MHETPVECTYDPCSCSVVGPAEGGEAYCSSFCRDATESSLEGESCACAHPQCDVP